MSNSRLHRRALLRGAGSIAIALPWLEIMGHPSEAKAQKSRQLANRFLAVYTPGGTVIDRWRPSGSEFDFNLSPILSPFESVKDDIVVVDGLDMKSAIGEIHQGGIVAWLTGTGQSRAHRDFAWGPSVDQVIATALSKRNRIKKSSIEIAIRWATGKSHGLLHPINSVNFADNADFSPIPPRLDPVKIWENLFGTQDPDKQHDALMRVRRKLSILDFLDGRYKTLAAKLGAGDRQKLEKHLDKIREIEKDLQDLPDETCEGPELIDTSDYDPYTGLNSDDGGAVKDTSTDAAIPKVGRLMIDMMVMAFGCDITGVGSLQWSDTEAKHTFPWLNLSEHHHYYQHDGGFRPRECEQICTWYSEQHAYLISEMGRVDMGGHTLLDESVVFFGSELSEPPTHRKNSMPFVLAGRGGGLKTGRYLKYDHLSHNKLLVSLCNLFGDDRREFGDPKYSDGPLERLV